MHHVFLDTNALLQFYKYTSDDLAQLEKIAAHVASGEISVITTSHVKDEIARNREKVIAETIKSLRDLRFPKEFPSMAKTYDLYKNLRKRIGEAEAEYKDLVVQLDKDIAAQNLQADQVLKSYFAAAKVLDIDVKIEERAARRMALGSMSSGSACRSDRRCAKKA